MRKILLTEEETIKLEMFLHMTTQYRKNELDTCQSLAQEKQPDGSDKYPNMLENAVWCKELITALENVQKAIDNAPYEENKRD